jgi:hypothetical protein
VPGSGAPAYAVAVHGDPHAAYDGDAAAAAGDRTGEAVLRRVLDGRATVGADGEEDSGVAAARAGMRCAQQ